MQLDGAPDSATCYENRGWAEIFHNVSSRSAHATEEIRQEQQKAQPLTPFVTLPFL